MKYINVDDLEKTLKKKLRIPDTSPEQAIFNRGVQTCLMELSRAEKIEVAEGEWIPRLHASENDIFICSNCNRECGYDPKYCPNCGAKMSNPFIVVSNILEDL